MKKKVSLLLVLVLCVSMTTLFTGCGKAYNYDLTKYVTLGDYSGLAMDKISVKVSDKEIQTEINTRLKAAAKTTNVKTGTVKDGDTINIAYVGKVDGKEFDGGTSDSADITIGTTSMIDGFTSGLIGKKVGDTVTLNLTFPETYSANTAVAGKDVVFKVTINTKQVKTTPEFNLTFVKANSTYKTIADYKASVKKDLYDSKYSDAEYARKNTLWEKIVKSSTIIDYPTKELKLKEKDTTKYYEDLAKTSDMTYDDYITEQMGMTSDQFTTQIEEYAKTVVGQEMIMYAIAGAEDITVTDKEYDAYLAKLLKDAGLTESTFEKSYSMTVKEYGEKNDFRTGLLLEKVLDFVVKNAVESK